MNELTTAQAHDLETLEGVVERGLATFVEVGRALAEIRDQRLYRAAHRTFEEYRHERWLLSRTRAYRLIDAAAVVSPIGDIEPPKNEAQARELVPLLREDEQEVVEVWRDLRAEFGHDVTAKRVRTTVRNRVKRIKREREAEQRGEELRRHPPDLDSAVPTRPPPAGWQRRHALGRALECLAEAGSWLEQAEDSLLDIAVEPTGRDAVVDQVGEACTEVREGLDDLARRLAEFRDGDAA